MNQDMVMEILSHSPASVVGKFKLLNKECNKRTYNSSFLKVRVQRTNSVSGYFIEYWSRLTFQSSFVEALGNRPCGTTKPSLDFLPPGEIQISACDASHGILLCFNCRPGGRRQREYMVCKPTTKQYRILPKPKLRYSTGSLGLMVIGSNPFRYKIMRLSYLPWRESRRYNLNAIYVCEVFDSDTFAWKRLNNLELPKEETLSMWERQPTASYGFLHWLTTSEEDFRTSKNVIRFCFETETWSYIPVPENLASATSQKLARYEGKLGMICTRSKEGVDYEEIWVLESISGGSWVKVQEIENIGLKTVGFLANDVVTLADVARICLYDMNNGKTQNLQWAQKFPPCSFSAIRYFPLYSDHERVEFNGRFSDCQHNKSHYGDDNLRKPPFTLVLTLVFFSLLLLCSIFMFMNLSIV